MAFLRSASSCRIRVDHNRRGVFRWSLRTTARGTRSTGRAERATHESGPLEDAEPEPARSRGDSHRLLGGQRVRRDGRGVPDGDGEPGNGRAGHRGNRARTVLALSVLSLRGLAMATQDQEGQGSDGNPGLETETHALKLRGVRRVPRAGRLMENRPREKPGRVRRP